jgi:hypothetical protein
MIVVLNERQSDRRSAAKKARTKLLNEVGGVEERGKRRTVATRGWRVAGQETAVGDRDDETKTPPRRVEFG